MKLMQHYSDITTVNAIGGTFAKPLKPPHKPSFAKEPPSQRTSIRHEMTTKQTTEKEGRRHNRRNCCTTPIFRK